MVKSIDAVRAHISELVAGEITTDQLYADFAKIASLEVAKATFNYANIKELDVGVINALVGKFEEIAAGELIADELYASFAEIINLAAKNLEADSLSAALGNFVTMYAGTGEFDFATIQNLVAKAMALQQGSMDTVYIKNLAVTTANMLSATLGKLVIKGDDGKYYRVFVSGTGEISTEEVQPTEEEIESGQTSGGQQITETNLNVGNLNATTIQGSSAVINQILTIALNAEKITAADALIASATIPALYATSIRAIGDNLDLSANKSVQIMVGGKNAVHRGETPPGTAAIGDLWVQPSTGYTYQRAGNDGEMPEWAIDANGVLYYRYADDQTAYELYMDENGDMYMESGGNFGMMISDDGVPLLWQRIKDSDLTRAELKVQDDAIIGVVTTAPAFKTTRDLAENTAHAVTDLEAALTESEDRQTALLETQVQQLLNEIGLYVKQDELETYLKVLIEGVRIGRNNSLYNVLVTNTGVNIRYSEDTIASFIKRQLTSPSVRIASPADQAQKRCVMRVAADGGMMIVNEEAIV